MDVERALSLAEGVLGPPAYLPVLTAEVRRLRAELSATVAERDRAITACGDIGRNLGAVESERDCLRAANAALVDVTKALSQHLALFCGPDDGIASELQRAASTALAKAQEGGEG